MRGETLHCLGTGGFHPTQTRHTACYLLRNAGIVLDAGTGLFRLRELLTTKTLDILLTHAHLDHCQGLTYLLDVLWERPIERVTIHGREQDLAVVRDHLFGSPLFPVECKYELRPLQSRMEIAGWNIRWREQEHPGGSVGYRLESETVSFAYVTDMTADPREDSSVAFIENVDLLLHECYFSDAHEDLARRSGHAFASAVGELASACRARHLLLCHVNPIAEEVETANLLTAVRKHVASAKLADDQLVLFLDELHR